MLYDLVLVVYICAFHFSPLDSKDAEVAYHFSLLYHFSIHINFFLYVSYFFTEYIY